MNNRTRIASLDGWRGIAILLVLIDHLNPILKFSRMPAVGHHGITIFFVLSGFLITNKLLEPDVSLRHFYVRRFFRLTPVAWIFLLVAWLFGWLTHAQVIWPGEVAACVFFFRNYVGDVGRNFTLHFWTLSIEEQFYLFWPAVLVLLGRKRAFWFAMFTALGSYGCLLLNPRFYVGANIARTEVRADSILVGCSFALLLQAAPRKDSFLRIMKMLALPTILIVTYFTCFSNAVPGLIECIGWGALIAASSLSSRPSFLSWKPLTWVGRISYSLYVWNIFLLVMFSRLPLLALLALLVSVTVLSYYYIEIPMQNLGARLLRKHDFVEHHLVHAAPQSPLGCASPSRQHATQ